MKPKIRVIPATEAKNRFGEMIKSAYLRDEHLIVKRDGVPVVAIVPIADYERFINPEDLPASLRAEIASSSKGSTARTKLASLIEFLDSVHASIPAVDEVEAERDILEAIQEVRAKRAKRSGRISA